MSKICGSLNVVPLANSPKLVRQSRPVTPRIAGKKTRASCSRTRHRSLWCASIFPACYGQFEIRTVNESGKHAGFGYPWTGDLVGLSEVQQSEPIDNLGESNETGYKVGIHRKFKFQSKKGSTSSRDL